MDVRRAAVAALVVAAGCGEPEPLGAREYVAQADAICREVAGRWRGLDPPAIADPVTEEELVAYQAWEFRTGAELGGEVIDRVGYLTPPAALEADAARMLDALEGLVDVVDAYAAAVETGDEAELARLEEEAPEDGDEAYRRAARKLGLRWCARGGFLSSWRAGAVPQATQQPLEIDHPGGE